LEYCLAGLLAMIPLDVHRDGLWLAALQASLRGRRRGNCHPGELGAAFGGLELRRRQDWSGLADSVRLWRNVG